MSDNGSGGEAWHTDVLGRAVALGEQGRWEEMATSLRDALNAEPDDPYVLGWLGVAEQELGLDESARERFRRCLAQNPADPQLLALAGSALAAWDDPDAEVALRAAALSGPDIPAARLQYGAYLARHGLLDEALGHLKEAVRLDPDDPVAYAELGGALALTDHLDDAIDAMEEALERAPEDEWTRVLVGLMHLERGGSEEAARELLAASSRATEDMEAQALAALAAAAISRDVDAQEALIRAEEAARAGDGPFLQEIEEAIEGGPKTARMLLEGSLGPMALRDRLSAPL
ncbi:MAG: tetratricopeptide repeat protein [Gemmatimonadota bacterium]